MNMMMRKLAGSVVVTAMLILAVPAQAQSFGMFFGDQSSEKQASDMWDEPLFVSCMTDRQIRDFIAARGYTNIALNVPNERHIQVRGTKDGWVYLIDLNYCAARISGVQQLRPAK